MRIFHGTRRWEQALNGQLETVGLAWATILGFIRIVTSWSVLQRPLPAHDGIAIVQNWLNQDSVQIVTPGERHADFLFRLLEGIGIAGNLTTDAHLAALALEYRAQLASTDTDFARFPALRWFNPVAERPRRPR